MYQKTKNSIKMNQDRLNQEKMSIFSKLGMAIKLFFLYLAHSTLHAFALLFTSPEKCFVMATNQDPKGTWSKSYYKHLLFQRRVRLYSTTSFFTIIIAVITASLAFNIIFPPTEIKFASAAGTTWTVTNNNDSGAGSLRWALASASNGDTVDATGVAGTVTLASILNIPSGLTVNLGTLELNAAAVSPGVRFSGVSDTTVNNLTVSDSSATGVIITNSSSNININDCLVSDSASHGIAILGASENITIDGCQIYGSGTDGIHAEDSENNTITNCLIEDNGQDNIEVSNSARSYIISDNTIINAGGRGINITGSSDSAQITGNNINASSQAGIRVDSSDYLTISNNTSNASATGKGIVLNESSENIISGNTLNGNFVYGLSLMENCFNNLITSNNISLNASSGAIIATGNTGNYFHSNIITDQSISFVFEDSNSDDNVNQVVYSSDNNILYIDELDNNLTSEASAAAQVYLGNEGDALSDYLTEDISLAYGAFQDQIDVTGVDLSSYEQICLLGTNSENTTFSPDCESIVEDNTAPVLSISSSGTAVTLSATDDTDSSPNIYYTTDGTTPTTSSTAYSAPFTVTAGTTVKAIAVDWVENSSTVVEETIEGEIDTTAPVISNLKAASVTATTATITWATDEAATSQVLYGLSENNLNKVFTDTNLVASHSVQLIGLDPATKYYYKVKSADGSGNLSVSAVNNFTTATDTIPVILDPENGDIVYTRKPIISGTAPAEASLNLYIDKVYHNQGTASEEGEFALQTKKLTADEHVARVKNNDSGEKSSQVSFTVATIKTTDKILISGDYADTLNTTNNLQPKLIGNFYINGYQLSDFTVQVFIDDQLNGLVKDEDIKITSNTSIASFTYTPFLKLAPGTHEAYIKVLRDSSAVQVNKVGGLASEIVTETSETRTFYVNGYSAPTLKFSNNKILVNARSGAIVRLYLDGTAYQEISLGEDSSGTAGASIDVSSLEGSHIMTATARPADLSPESKLSEELSFTVTSSSAAPIPTTPIIEDEDEDEEIVVVPDQEVDTDEDGLTDEEEEELGTDPVSEDTDGDGFTDEEEIIIGQDPKDDSDTKDLTEEEIIKKKEIIFEDKAAEDETPKQYPVLGEEIVKMTDQEKKELKDEAREKIKETVINIKTDGQEQGAYINPNTGQTTISFPQTLDIGDSFREAFGGQPKEQASSNLTFSGVVPVVAGAKSYVILTVKSDPVVRIAEADANGQWTLSVPVDYLPEGEHTAYLQTEVNGVPTEQVQIARFVLQEQERFSNTTIFFIVNIAVAIFALLLAIFLQLRKNRKLIEQMNQEAA